jgi:hypothetical protein
MLFLIIATGLNHVKVVKKNERFNVRENKQTRLEKKKSQDTKHWHRKLWRKSRKITENFVELH